MDGEEILVLLRVKMESNLKEVGGDEPPSKCSSSLQM